MSIETRVDLHPRTINQLQLLIRIHLDASRGFKSAQSRTEDPQLKDLMEALADERARFANELQEFIAWNGSHHETSGSLLATLHQTWMKLQALLSAGDLDRVLNAIEASEQQVLQIYRQTLSASVGCSVNQVLKRQHARIEDHQRLIEQLRSTSRLSHS